MKHPAPKQMPPAGQAQGLRSSELSTSPVVPASSTSSLVLPLTELHQSKPWAGQAQASKKTAVHPRHFSGKNETQRHVAALAADAESVQALVAGQDAAPISPSSEQSTQNSDKTSALGQTTWDSGFFADPTFSAGADFSSAGATAADIGFTANPYAYPGTLYAEAATKGVPSYSIVTPGQTSDSTRINNETVQTNTTSEASGLIPIPLASSGSVVGAAALLAAAAGGGGGSNNPSLEPSKTSFSIKLALGPVSDGGQGTEIKFYTDQGVLMSGTGAFSSAGIYTFTPDTPYSGKVFIRVLDNDPAADYIDETTGKASNIGSELWAATEVSSNAGAVQITVSPLSTVAVKKALQTDSLEQVIAKVENKEAASADVVAANKAIAKLFGIGDVDLAKQNVEFAIDTSGQPLASANAYGKALMVVSNFEAVNTQTTSNLSSIIKVNNDGSAGFVSSPATDLFIQTAKSPVVAQQTQASVVAIQNATVVIDSNAPLFFAGATQNFSIPENTSTFVASIKATDDVGVAAYSLVNNNDASLFTVDAATGALSFIATPDFETPGSAAGSNVYTVQVKAADAAGNTAVQTVTVNVSNVDDTAPVIATTALSVSTTDASGASKTSTLVANDQVVLTLALGEAASGLSGLPTGGVNNVLAIGGVGKTATWSQSGNTLVLTYAVATGDAGAISLDKAALLSALGSSIKDLAGNAATLPANFTAPSMPSNAVDAAAPVFAANALSLSTTDASGVSKTSTLAANDKVLVTLALGEAASGLSGLPTGNVSNVLAIGGVNKTATWSTSGDSLMLSYAVAAGDAGAISLDKTTLLSALGSSIKDLAGNAAVLPSSFTSPDLPSNAVDAVVPVFTAGASTSVSFAENGTGTVYTPSASDNSAIASYEFAGGADDGKFTVNTNTGAISFKQAPDFETPASAAGSNAYTLKLRVKDPAGNSAVQTVTVNVSDVDDTAPVIAANALSLNTTDASGTGKTSTLVANDKVLVTLALGEAASGLSGLPTGNVNNVLAIGGVSKTATWSASGDSLMLSYTVAAGDAGAISLDKAALLSALGSSIKDLAGNAATLPASFSAPNMPSYGVDAAPPIFTAGAITSINFPENGSGSAYTPAVSDDSAIARYEWAGGSDDGLFQLDARTGAVSFTQQPSYDHPGSAAGSNAYALRIRATDAVGNSAVQTVTVQVTQVDTTAPVFAAGASTSVNFAENGTGTVYTPSASDNSAIASYEFAGGADDGKFTINTNTGAISFKQAPDFETPASAAGSNAYTLKLRVKDPAGNSAVQTVTVNVSDVDDTAPVIAANALSLSTTDASGVSKTSTLVANDKVLVTLALGEAVSGLTGLPTGSVNNVLAIGGEGKTATWSASGNSLLLSCTVAAGDAGAITLDKAALLSALGSSIKDLAGNAAALPANFTAPSMPSNAVDAVAPSLATSAVSVSTTDASGTGKTSTLVANDKVLVTLALGEAASGLSGLPTGSVNNVLVIGGVSKTATWSASGNSLLLSYTVAAGDAGAISLDKAALLSALGSSIKDLAGNAATLPANFTAPSMPSNAVDAAAPVFAAGASTSVSFAENSTGTVYTPSASDNSAIASYEFAGGADDGKFSINANTGAISFKQAPDFETPASAAGSNAYTLKLRVKDALGNSAVQTLTVNVSDVDEIAPTQNIAALTDTQLTALEAQNFSLSYTSITDASGVKSNTATVKDALGNVQAVTLTVDETARRIYGDLSSLTNGSYTVNIQSTDNFGNIAVTNRAFVIDKTAPSITLTLNDGVTPGGTSTDYVVAENSIIDIGISGETSAVSKQYSLNGGRNWTALAAAATTLTLPAGGYAGNQIQLKATDAAGNESVQSINNTVKSLATSYSWTAPDNSIQTLGSHYTTSDIGGSPHSYYLLSQKVTVQQLKDMVTGQLNSSLSNYALGHDTFKIGDGIFRLINLGDPGHYIGNVTSTTTYTASPFVGSNANAGFLGIYYDSSNYAGPSTWQTAWKSNTFLGTNDGYGNSGLMQIQPSGSSYIYTPGLNVNSTTLYNVAFELIDTLSTSSTPILTINPVTYDDRIDILETSNVALNGFVSGITAGAGVLSVTLTQGNISKSFDADVLSDGTWSLAGSGKIDLSNSNLSTGAAQLNIIQKSNNTVLANKEIVFDFIQDYIWVGGYHLIAPVPFKGSDGKTHYLVTWDIDNANNRLPDPISMNDLEKKWGISNMSYDNNSVVIDGKYKLTLPTFRSNTDETFTTIDHVALKSYDGLSGTKTYSPGTWGDYFDASYTGSSTITIPQSWYGGKYWAANHNIVTSPTNETTELNTHVAVELNGTKSYGNISDTSLAYIAFEFTVL